MTNNIVSGGLVHTVPKDLKTVLLASPKALLAWENISVKARNEWICWTVTVKQEKTRQDHVVRTCSQLAEGKRRPCCWVGCIHRTDKAVSPWAQKVLIDKQPKSSAR
ncbi:YdeI/OmpD-associated family protein [Polaromonas sp.]|nr:YdeI/OmpD-associated family protein [Candidatus Saccharibacteria bacterium]